MYEFRGRDCDVLLALETDLFEAKSAMICIYMTTQKEKYERYTGDARV